MLYSNFVHPWLVAYVTFCMFVSVASTVPLRQRAPALGMQCTRQELVCDCALPSLWLLNKSHVNVYCVQFSVCSNDL